jgi:hypothetical protein
VSGFSEARVVAVMRELRCDYRTACAELGRRGVARRLWRAAAAKRREERLTVARGTWAWRESFE